MYNDFYMTSVIEAAKNIKDDIPIAAAIVKGEKILALKTNKREKLKNVTYHAEMLAISEVNKILGNWRLDDCDLYVTLEPCPMCAWAIISSRIKNLYFGSYDIRYGGFSGNLNLNVLAKSSINVQGGFREEECDKILKNYFERIRNEKIT